MTRCGRNHLPTRRSSRGTQIVQIGWIKLVVLLVVLVAAVYWSSRQFSPPPVVSSSSPEVEFSAERAFTELERLADEPRPVGSPGHVRAQRFLIQAIRDSGLKPGVKRHVAVDSLPEDAQARAASVTHILTRLNGTGDGPPIILAAHYDSFSGGTAGAMDCGSCVVTLLEAMRALSAREPLERDVVFAFTDAEERVSVGVHSLVDEPPLSEADTVLNFEAGGSGGSPIVIQVSDHSGAVIDALADEVPSSVANSIVPVLFSAAQAGDDFEVFRDELGEFAGLDFASFLHRWSYHTDLDNLEEADPGTIQQNGEIATGITRALGSAASTPQVEPKVFFTVVPGVTVTYPEWLGLALTALLTVALVALVLAGRRRGAMTVGSVLRGVGTTLLAMVVAFIAAVVVWELVALVNPGYDQMLSFGRPITYNAVLYLGAFAALTVGLTGLLVNRFVGRHGAVAMTAGATAVSLLLAWLTVGAPGFSYLFVWPALFALIGAAWLLFSEHGELSWLGLGALAVAATPGVILVALAVTIIVLGLFGIAASGLPITTLGVPMLLIALLVCLLAAQLSVTPRWLVPRLATLAAAGFFVAGQLTSGFSEDRPRPNVVAYELDAGEKTAEWVSPGGEPDEWTQQFFADEYRDAEYETFLLPAFELPAIAADAPVADLPAPRADVVSDRIRGDARQVRVRIRSPRRAPNLLVNVEAPASIEHASVEGVEIDRGATPDDLADQLELLYSAPPARGIELELRVDGPGPLDVELADISEGLPEVDRLDPRPRPADMQALPTQVLDPTIVRRSVELK